MTHSVHRWRRHRLAVALTAIFLLAQVVTLLGTAGPANAATCPTLVSASFGTESVITFNFAPQCSDGAAQIWGTLSDPLCDDRAAMGRYVLYDRLPDGTYTLVSNKGWIWKNGNGCGTSTTFSDRTNSPGSIGWKLVVQAEACNFWGCSSVRSQTYYG
jgi:hypothetical protein